MRRTLPAWRVVWLGLTVLVLIILGAGIYTARALLPLREAEGILTTEIGDLNGERLDRGLESLGRADSILRSWPARFLKLIPVARQNIAALAEVSSSAATALHDARRLEPISNEALRQGLMTKGRADISRIEALAKAFEAQRDSLAQLQSTIREHRNGWVLPPLFDRLGALAERNAELLRGAERASIATGIAPAMLGRDGPRSYLMLLINNAELRGAGGIVSGVGTVSFHRGRFDVGRFRYYGDLARATGIKQVPSPPDLKRRFGRYRSDTTLWINLTASPDIPEVARTAAAIHRAGGGRSVDGVIVVDPRGLESLIRPGHDLVEPRSGLRIVGADIPRFVYSRAYEVFDGDQARRRETLLSLGPKVLDALIRVPPDAEVLRSIGRAAEGSHIRIVSLDRTEQAVLGDLGVSGELSTPADASLLVTVQNLGADKLDYWMRREITHTCTLDAATARCTATVVLRNETPRGLPRYVVQDKKRYGTYRGYLELYVPEEAKVTGFIVEREGSEAFTEGEDGLVSLGIDFSTRRGSSTRAEIRYEVPVPEGSFSMETTPQPLAHDAELEVSLVAPEGWLVGPSGEERNETFSTETMLSTPLRLIAKPRQSPPGIPGIWDALKRFWNDPIV